MTTIDPATLKALNGTGNAAAAAATTAKKDDVATADRFLKLLVAQMQNQDPLNPMDNAQVTSQMAQINTVTGIEKLNTTVGGLNAQFAQVQALQGAGLVGRDITVAGNRIEIADGVGRGGFELASGADNVKIEVLDANKKVVRTLDLGKVAAGRHTFGAPATDAVADAVYRFRVVATAGGKELDATPLMRDHVDAVGIRGDQMTLDTRYSGTVPYGNVLGIN